MPPRPRSKSSLAKGKSVSSKPSTPDDDDASPKIKVEEEQTGTPTRRSTRAKRVSLPDPAAEPSDHSDDSVEQDDDDNEGQPAIDNLGDMEFHDSEDEWVAESEEEEEEGEEGLGDLRRRMAVDDDDQDDVPFHFPPGVGSRDTRDSEVVQQIRDLFSSDDEDLDDEAMNAMYEDIMEEGYDKETLKKMNKKKRKQLLRPSKMKDEANVYYQLAQKEYENNALEDAILMCEEAIKHDPDSKLPYWLLDVIYSDLGDVEKSLKAKVAAALLDKNADEWIDVARISADLGHLDQATIFYSRAIELDETDVATMFELVELYLKLNKISPARDVMVRAHRVEPANPEVTNQLGRIYLMQGMIQDAVNLFENILQQNKDTAFLDPEQVQPFRWSELNSLAELYYKQKAWHKTIRSIKSIARWLLERGNETWWDDVKNDAEFDERRDQVKKNLSKENEEQYQLPLDIRVKLLMARMQLGDFDEAREHTKILLKGEPEVYLDLYWEVGVEYMELGHYEEGLELLNQLLPIGDQAPSDLLLAIGKCEMGLKNWTQAENLFRLVLESDPENIEALVGLAETCYALNRDDEALAYIEEVRDIRQAHELREQDKSAENKDKEDDPTSFYKKRRTRESKTTTSAKTVSKLEKMQAEQKAIATVETNFRTLQRYWSQLAQNINNMVAVTEWTQIANGLVNMFLSVKRFYHRHGTRLTIFQKGEDADIDARLEKLSVRLKEVDNDADAQETQEKGEVVKVYRGLPIDTWFDIFMQVSCENHKPSEYVTNFI